MKIRLVRETENNHTFWKVQRWSFWFGWCLVSSVDSVTCDEKEARALFDWLVRGNAKQEQVLDEADI